MMIGKKPSGASSPGAKGKVFLSWTDRRVGGVEHEAESMWLKALCGTAQRVVARGAKPPRNFRVYPNL